MKITGRQFLHGTVATSPSALPAHAAPPVRDADDAPRRLALTP